jgi:hypothetical protein
LWFTLAMGEKMQEETKNSHFNLQFEVVILDFTTISSLLWSDVLCLDSKSKAKLLKAHHIHQ